VTLGGGGAKRELPVQVRYMVGWAAGNIGVSKVRQLLGVRRCWPRCKMSGGSCFWTVLTVNAGERLFWEHGVL